MSTFRINDGVLIDHTADGWPEFKKWIDGTNASLRYTWVSEEKYYSVVAVDGSIYRLCDFNKGDDAADFEANFKARDSKLFQPKTSDGKVVFSSWPTEGSRSTQLSPNWCDKTTWYYHSIKVIDEVAVVQNSPDNTIYKVKSGSLIDVYHGKISNEDYITNSEGSNCHITVKVNDVIKTEQDPHLASGGDYTIAHGSGTVMFNYSLLADDVVKMTYNYATTSEWVLKPTAGKILKIKRVEVQFSSDIMITDTIKFQPYVFGAPYGNPTVYKTMMDYINEANGAYPTIPPFGMTADEKTNWRNTSKDIITLPWDYQTLMELKSSYYAEVRISLEHDIPFGGNVATAAFYCLVEDE